MQIAIDGPAGSGKSIIAKILADKYDFTYIDTGAMYRAMALYMIKHNIDINDENIVSAECIKVNIDLSYENTGLKLFLNNEDVSSEIRREEVGNSASVVSSYKIVRERLVRIQRQLASAKNVIMDGRDIGTNVLINADIKIFLTASVSVRANRRAKELNLKGLEVDIKKIEADIENRDYRDTHRELNPLCKAVDAIEIDSSDMSVEDVVNMIGSIIDGDYKNS